MEEMKKVYENLTEENKSIINMVAKGMEVAQNINVKKGEEKENVWSNI